MYYPKQKSIRGEGGISKEKSIRGVTYQGLGRSLVALPHFSGGLRVCATPIGTFYAQWATFSDCGVHNHTHNFRYTRAMGRFFLEILHCNI